MTTLVAPSASTDGVQYDADGVWYYSPTGGPGTWLYGAPGEAPVFLACIDGPHDCSNGCGRSYGLPNRGVEHYTVVEAVCEACGVVNDHFTAYCPYPVIASSDPVAAAAGEAFLTALGSRIGWAEGRDRALIEDLT